MIEPGTRIGRYLVERVLGEGGMGVVYAASDPDLERQVALKVLRDPTGGDADDARARLLREARAMARLQHPNVVTVHEVGRIDEHDFVAMELVSGETLADWLAAAPRTHREIVDAFIAAGRGLAAAHAEGLVHRDFKPHNVLRSKSGRVLVTDFGLARAVEQRADPMAKTLPPSSSPSSAPPAGSLAKLTVPGTVLGTPAYMAPEQWTGGRIGPATDQFAFCVALWEALVGERPFRGTTEEELRTEVARGPATLDTSKLPRRLRRSLVRGLAPKAAERWPNMDALLARLRYAERRPVIAAAIVGGVAVTGGAFLAFHGRGAAAGCDPPARDPELVWSARERAQVRAGVAVVFDHEAVRWRDARGHACTAAVHQPQVACLDRALASFELAVHAARATHGAASPDAIYALLVDPEACAGEVSPRIAVATGPGAEDAAALVIERHDLAADDAAARAKLVRDRDPDPCSHVMAAYAAASATDDVVAHRALAAEAASSAERCGDDHWVALAALETARFEVEQPGASPYADAARAHAESAVARTPEPDVQAERDLVEASAAANRDEIARALELVEHAIAGFEKRGRERAVFAAISRKEQLRLERAGADDVAAVRADVASARTRALALGDPEAVASLDRAGALARMLQGDAAAAHASLLQAWKTTPPRRSHGSRQIAGEVVAADGTPIAGAEVYAAPILFTDSYGVLPLQPELLRSTTTDLRGQFTLVDAPASGRVMAIAGDRRSLTVEAADRVHLVATATRVISGHVDLDARARLHVVGFVSATGSPGWIELVPVASDGTFSAAGLPRLSLGVRAETGLSNQRDLVGAYVMAPSGDAISDLDVAARATGRHVFVIVRSSVSATLDQAMTALFRGHLAITKLGQRANHEPLMVAIAGVANRSTLPADVAREAHDGDLVARFDDTPPEPLSVCAVSIPAGTAGGVRLLATSHASELEVRCADVRVDATIVVVTTPPQPRFE